MLKPIYLNKHLNINKRTFEYDDVTCHGGDALTMASAVVRIQLNVFKLQIVNLEAAPDTEYVCKYLQNCNRYYSFDKRGFYDVNRTVALIK